MRNHTREGMMGPIRDEIAALEMSGISRSPWAPGATPRSSRSGSARATWSRPPFIREAAKHGARRGPHLLRNSARHASAARGAQALPRRGSTGSSCTPTASHVAGLDHADRRHRRAVPGRPRRRGDPDRPLLAQRPQCLHHDGGRPCRRPPGRGRRPLASRPRRVARAITPRTKAVYVNSPSNPTGWVMTRDGQRGLLDLCRAARARA